MSSGTRIAILALLLCGAAGAAQRGDPAPDFTLPDTHGNPVHLAAYRGKLVLVNFWASWCAPCLQEMPTLSRWQERFGPAGLQIIGISMDDGPAPVAKLLARHPVSYPVVMGDTGLARRWGGVLGLPQSYLIDAQGRVLERLQGETDLAALQSRIEAWLRDPAVAGAKP